MGCLFEIIAEALFELFFEGFLELMCFIVPKSGIGRRNRKILRMILKTVAIIGIIALAVGFFLMLSDDAEFASVGKTLVFTVLVYFAVQITLGLIMKIISAILRKRKGNKK